MCNENLAAQYEGTHLDANKALDCGVALAYFIKAFAALDSDEQAAWISAYSDDHRFELGSLMLSWGTGDDFVFYLALDQAGVVNNDVTVILDALNNSLDGTVFADREYANSYTAHLSKPLSRLQEANKSGESDASLFDSLLAMLEDLEDEDTAPSA